MRRSSHTFPGTETETETSRKTSTEETAETQESRNQAVVDPQASTPTTAARKPPNDSSLRIFAVHRATIVASAG